MRLHALDDAAEWERAWRDLPPDRREVYYHPAYHRVAARWEGAAPHCVRLEHGSGWMLCPYLLHPVPDGGVDAQTAYGYGGPLFVGEWSGTQREAALAALARHLHDGGAVAEFVRCHTEWADGDALRAAGYRVFQVRTNVECTLSEGPFDQTWASGARRNVRKARSAGLTARAGGSAADWQAFTRLYAMTAERLGMSPGYRFDEEYLYGLASVPGVRLLVVDAAGEAVAGAIVFVGGRLAHYHLGASDFAYQENRPNDLLYHGMAALAREAGCERIVWGGGMSNDPDDTLFRFKTHFGAVRRPVYCAGRVIDPEAYDRLCAQWQARHPDRESKLFLKYRA
jgi:hypothetical protein